MVADSSEKFTWVIENFSKLPDSSHFSGSFACGYCRWRLLILPKGKNGDFLSVFLEIVDPASLPSGWSRKVQFNISVKNQINRNFPITKHGENLFNAKTNRWGFPCFMSLSALHDPTRGYLMKDKLVIEVMVALLAEGVSNEESPSSEGIGDNLHIPIQVSDLKKHALVSENHHEASDNKKTRLTPATEVKGNGQGLSESCLLAMPLRWSDAAVNRLKNSQPFSLPEDETVNVNGFQVVASKAKAVERIFEKHPDVASNFWLENKVLRSAFIFALLDVIETLCRSPKELSEDDLTYVNRSLAEMENAGLKLDWLKSKLEEITKRRERAVGSQIDELRKQVEVAREMMLDLEDQLEKEKCRVEVARTPLSFDDIV